MAKHGKDEGKVVHNHRHNDVIESHSGEIPRLIINKTIGFSDFKTSEVYLESRGWSMAECLEGLQRLVDISMLSDDTEAGSKEGK